MVYFDAINDVWVISKGTTGIVFQDALAPDYQKIYTTHDIRVNESSKEFVSATAQCLYIVRQHNDGHKYYLIVER